MASFDRKREPKARRTMEWGTDVAIRKHGSVPDIIFDKGGMGKEPMIRVLGKSPEDIVQKMRPILGRVTP